MFKAIAPVLAIPTTLGLAQVVKQELERATSRMLDSSSHNLARDTEHMGIAAMADANPSRTDPNHLGPNPFMRSWDPIRLPHHNFCQLISTILSSWECHFNTLPSPAPSLAAQTCWPHFEAGLDAKEDQWWAPRTMKIKWKWSENGFLWVLLLIPPWFPHVSMFQSLAGPWKARKNSCGPLMMFNDVQFGTCSRIALILLLSLSAWKGDFANKGNNFAYKGWPRYDKMYLRYRLRFVYARSNRRLSSA